MSDTPRPLALVNIVGLTPELLRDHMPRMRARLARSTVRPLEPVLPAVTCSVQASMLTGERPEVHGIVGNGWYERDAGEIRFWKQSNRLIQAEPVWETARRRHPGFTCANCFWWYAMNASTDACITPRPMYPADGRKIPDIHTVPAELRETLQSELGPFPLFNFWGPLADIRSSRWIAAAAVQVHERLDPDLLLVYLPHLDYDLQRFGPDDPRCQVACAAIDEVASDCLDRLERDGRTVIIVSEYGLSAVRRTVAPNLMLREAGWLTLRNERGRDLMEPMESRGFAVADHQIAHVYLRDPEDLSAARHLFESCDGIAEVLDGPSLAASGLAHARSGDLVLVGTTETWFTWDYWRDDARAPDYARTVDIHRKPGYDPRELRFAPGFAGSRPRLLAKMIRRALGQRTLLDVISLDPSRVGGSHGRTGPGGRGLLMLPGTDRPLDPVVPCTAIRDLILEEAFGSR